MEADTRGINVIGVIPQYPDHSKHNIYAKVKMPPVGLVSILSQINHDPRLNEVYAIDENNYRGPRDFTGMPDHNFLNERNPAGIAMFYGGMSNSVPRLFSVAKQYQNLGAVTIAGGSHVDALPKEALSSGIDIVVHGEGEETAKEILEQIVKKESVKLDRDLLKNIKGISILDNKGDYFFTGKREPIHDLDSLEDIDLTLIKHLGKKWSAIPVNRGRGCNFNCEFCVVNKQYGRFKASSTEKAMRQIVKHSDMGYKDFFFTDDNFAQDTKAAIDLCKQIGDYKRKFNKKIRLTVQVRSEVAENDELINAMRYAGVEILAIGYESPINEELKSMKKGVTVEKLVRRSRKLAENFYLHGMFIFGYPTFKDSTIKSSLTLEQRAKEYQKFFKAAKIDTMQVFNAVPLPGSLLRQKLESENRVLPQEMVGWDKYDGLFLCYDPRPEGIDAYSLQNLQRMLMRKWYLGSFIDRKLNYGKWMNWTYNATIGFPIDYSIFYTKRFFHNLSERKRAKEITKDSLMGENRIFYTPLVESWRDIKRKWRNLTVQTYGRGIITKWIEEYKKSEYRQKIKDFFSRDNKDNPQ